MQKIAASLLLCSLTISAWANPQDGLKGFVYEQTAAPSGHEWESPQSLALNKEQPHAWFFNFAHISSACKVLPENSCYWLSLNGNWKFHWAPTPEERPKEFFQPEYDVQTWDEIEVPSSWNIYGLNKKNGGQKYGTPIYVNQPVIFQHKVAVDDWKGGVMRTPPAEWTTYKHRNEVGSYRRNFSVPQDWKDREIFINFDGVDSFFYIWVNGKYVGFSKNSRNLAQFNITPYINKKGTNMVAVEVYRSSDGSFLEAQDMFRLPGIFRTVSITSTPRLHVRDLVVTPDLDASYTNGELKIKAEIRNLDKKIAKDCRMVYSLYANKLYSDENVKINVSASDNVTPVEAGRSVVCESTIHVEKPNLWSAELPYRYTLVGELKDKKGRTVETVSTYVGFREVEIKETPAQEDEFGLAGRYYFVNGKNVKLKGVNRHETNPDVGHAITREMMMEEVNLMKRANINHVRCSHYPDDPYWYYLCDKYGIYLEDEANVESHEYYYGKASLSHPAEWKDAHVARVMEMVHSDINHPSVVIWSLGNEAGPGKNFSAAYDAIKKFDLSRPVQYERNNDIVDMGSNQYPSIAWVREAVKGTQNIKYPFHISEYAHSMGNAVGNLIDYWKAIESSNFLCGGAIWDWVDQSLYNYTADGVRYLAYGGDFGDRPNDGQFVMNGIVFGDLTPKPQYYEVKKVYQNIEVQPIDIQKSTYDVFNKNYFKSLDDYQLRWSLFENGKEIKNGMISMGKVPARSHATVTVPFSYVNLKPQSEYFVKLQFLQKEAKPWANKGYVQAEEQILVKKAAQLPAINTLTAQAADLTVDQQKDFTTVKGNGFEARFNMADGSLYALTYNGKTIITDGNGPKLDAMRAFTNNDNWCYTQWFECGLHNLKHKATAAHVSQRQDGSTVIAFTVESQAPNGAKIKGGTWTGHNSIEELTDKPFGPDDFKFTTNQIWTIYKDGSIELEASINSNRPSLVLPRLGYVMKMPKALENFNYYGRGPVENYADRKTGQFIECYQSKVSKEFTDYPKPQDMSNHEDVRWCALTDNQGEGALFVATERMSVAPLQHTAEELIIAGHPYQLPQAEDTYLHLDLAVTGLGGNSCGQGGPLVQDRVFANQHDFGFIIRPAQKDLIAAAQVSGSGEVPLTIVRDKAGKVILNSIRPNATIAYTLNKDKKVRTYTEPIDMKKGGSITAWFIDNPTLKNTRTFEKIEVVPVEVYYASSEETDEGNATNLVDGDPNTIWHTMYSVTVAKYPHWVDFDAGEVKMIKGFTYLPRQDGDNGMIKDYTLQVSQDGKNWSEPVAKGSFTTDKNLQKILLQKPVKARYIRFTGLNEQHGQDFASAAEMSILAE